MRLTLLIVFFITLLGCSKKDNSTNDALVVNPPELRGADMSFLSLVRNSGARVYNENGVYQDMMSTLKNAGMNMIRLRIWHSPTSSVSSFHVVKSLAQEAHQLGLKVMLTVHFSDTWADPAHQSKPAAWQQATYQTLQDSVYQYMKRIMVEIHPDFIAPGNELNQGFLWPEGSNSNKSQFVQLFNKAATAVREVDSTTKIVLHFAGYRDAENYYSQLNMLDYDIAGLSYYPIWHGKSLDTLSIVLRNLVLSTHKESMIVETSYPFTLSWYDQTTNIIGLEEQLINGYPATPEGQYKFLKAIREITGGTGRGCLGFCYWGGEWISFLGSTQGSTWENQALWDFQGNILMARLAFRSN